MRVNLNILFHSYEYKLRDPSDRNIKTYVKKSEAVDDNHPLGLTFKEWLEIVEAYFDEVFDYIFDGSKFRLGLGIGFFEIVKREYSVDRGATQREGKIIEARNRHTNGYSPYFKWTHDHIYDYALVHSKLWKCNMLEKSWNKLSNLLFEKPSTIMKFNNRNRK